MKALWCFFMHIGHRHMKEIVTVRYVTLQKWKCDKCQRVWYE